MGLMTNIIVGIDPGLDGAVALLNGDGYPEAVWDIPTVGTGKKTDREFNAVELFAILKPWAVDGGVHVYLEKIVGNLQPAGRAPGSRSLFRWGSTYGGIKAVIATLQLPLTLVSPITWKRRFGVVGKDKEGSRLRALELFPMVSEKLHRKKDHGRAEALLIAYHGFHNAHMTSDTKAMASTTPSSS